MKKLIFATLGLVVLLLISMVARNANFNLQTIMKNSFGFVHSANSLTANGNAPTPTTPVEIYITLTPYDFVPGALSIEKGTKLIWMNKSGKDTEVIFTPSPTGFSNQPFGNNSSFSYTFNRVGRYTYYNKNIPTQRATIIVE